MWNKFLIMATKKQLYFLAVLFQIFGLNYRPISCTKISFENLNPDFSEVLEAQSLGRINESSVLVQVLKMHESLQMEIRKKVKLGSSQDLQPTLM